MTPDAGHPAEATRRQFIQATTAAAMAAAAAAAPRRARAQDSRLRIGLVGCGGRGSGAANEALQADPNTVLWALADAVREPIDDCLKKFKRGGTADRVDVAEERVFVGLEGYKACIEQCDVILLAAPPAFRPAHLRACVDAGKHVFCEKPIAVDPAGVRHVVESCAIAKQKSLSLVSGLCYRYENAKRDTIGRIRQGALGDILSMQTTYNTGGLWHRGRKPEWSEVEYQVRNWLYFDWLSGDHIVEQHIHSLDKILWVMGDVPPVRATASGGRTQRTGAEFGNIYDHFNTVYEWENGLKAFSSCRQWVNCSTDVSDHIVGTLGSAELQSHTIRFRDGNAWQHEPQGEDNMYQNEHNALFASIRAGEPINDGDYMCKSTMMAILGRLAAYTGKTLKWDDLWNSDFRIVPEAIEFGMTPPAAVVAVPGEYKIA